MATRMELPPFARFTFPFRVLSCRAFPRLLSFLVIFFALISQASAQTSTQQYVYLSLPGSPPSSPSSLISAFTKAGQTGALNSVTGSPFSDRLEGGLVAIDGQGKFLFLLNPTSNDISMFQIDQTTGALSEVPGSPFAVPPAGPNPAPSKPISISAEPSGKFLFVGFFTGDLPGNSAVVSLAINTSGSAPALSIIQTLDLLAAPLQLLTDPKGLRLYAGLTQGPNGMAAGGAEVFSIDSSTGMLANVGTADSLTNNGLSYAIDPQNRFFFAAGHDFLQSCTISPVDGTANTCSPLLFLDPTNVQSAAVAENSGHFLYVYQSGASPGVVVYSLDQTTGALAQVLGPLSGIQFANGSTVADPMGPYIYSAQFAAPTLIHAYQVDSQTGNLTEIIGSPFNAGASANCCGGLAISGNPTQAVSGPAASIFPSTATFTSVVGVPSPTQVFSIVNTGDQLLALNSISITGANASSFSQTNTCLATLAPNANCSVSIDFTPAAVGALTANLQVADNAPGSPQTLVLNGTGIAPAPAVTFSPPAPSFPATDQGASSAPQTLTVISSGNTTLHISLVSLAGPNPSDFSLTNNCTAPLAPGSNCAISLVFNPTAPGQRTADLMIADDAQGSPQAIVLTGTGIAVVPALTFSPPAPSFPATTQGTSSAPQSISVINSGNAPLQISSVSLGGSSASQFSLSSNCTTALAPAASCTVSLVFSPVATGQSAAMLTVTDDAPGSPQSASISGTAAAAFSVAPASGSSTNASVSAGQPAQYQLQLTPGTGFTGTVGLSCGGAPLDAVCQVPASVSLANGTPATFTVTVTTSGPAQLPPVAPLRVPPVSRVPLSVPIFLALLFSLLAFFINSQRVLQPAAPKNRLALWGMLSSAVFCITFVLTGCGGGAASITTTPPPPVITPSGTSTITISLSAASSTGQPLQLPPIQLTLTVK
ncbi:MAG TPA: choice-of-anchor D domain-containing protein [Candidatus Acidoferrum sp.]|nr:choice-of-anchor D domain-containing protein [Candidatus Acidoferrum sp.]